MISNETNPCDVDWNENVEFTCIECGDTHHPSKRAQHEFRVDTTICPECEGTRKLITHDHTKQLSYNEDVLNRVGLEKRDITKTTD